MILPLWFLTERYYYIISPLWFSKEYMFNVIFPLWLSTEHVSQVRHDNVLLVLNPLIVIRHQVLARIHRKQKNSSVWKGPNPGSNLLILIYGLIPENWVHCHGEDQAAGGRDWSAEWRRVVWRVQPGDGLGPNGMQHRKTDALIRCHDEEWRTGDGIQCGPEKWARSMS